MKIAHIADIHINSRIKASNIEKTAFLLKRVLHMNYDHIVITGDLSDDADDQDFEILREMFLHFGILNSDRLTLVIGNHDIFGGVQTVEDIFNFPEKCRSTDYSGQVTKFYDYFKETFDNVVSISDYLYPFAKKLGDTLLVGMNSIAEFSAVNNPVASNGFVGERQLEETRQLFETFGKDAKNRLVLIHHHFEKMKEESKNLSKSLWLSVERTTMKLRKKKRLYKLFKEHNVDAILHGHIHFSHSYERKGLRFSNAGGSVKNSASDIIFLNTVDLNTIKPVVSIEKLRFQAQPRPQKDFHDVASLPGHHVDFERLGA